MPSTSALRGNLAQDQITIPVGGAANVILTTDQIKYQRIAFSGLLTASISVQFPVAAPDDQGKTWSLGNICTGVFTLTVKAPGATGFILSQGFRQDVAFDGVDMVPNDAAALGCSVASVVVAGATTLTLAQARAGIIALSGTPGAPFILTVPNGTALYLIANNTGSTCTVATAAGVASGNILTGKYALVFIDAAGNGNLINASP